MNIKLKNKTGKELYPDVAKDVRFINVTDSGFYVVDKNLNIGLALTSTDFQTVNE